MGQRVYNLKSDKEDMRDMVFRSEQFKTASQLPLSVDLRPKMSPVVDQGELGSCTANAIASGLREYIELNYGHGQLVNLSRLWLYWQERELEDSVGQDAGASIRDGMSVLQKLGCAPETDFPYDITRFTETPSDQSDMDANAYKISAYHRVTSVKALKASLAQGMPVVLGISVHESFESAEVARTGIVPMPGRGDKALGGHAVLAVGYTHSVLGVSGMQVKGMGYVICRNSWGTSWGDKGYFYLPEAYFTKYVSDMWSGM